MGNFFDNTLFRLKENAKDKIEFKQCNRSFKDEKCRLLIYKIVRRTVETYNSY